MALAPRPGLHVHHWGGLVDRSAGLPDLLAIGARCTQSSAWPLVVLGAGLFAMGMGIALWAGYYLIHHGDGTPFPLDSPRRLVTNGPYRFVRNPQAIAMVLMVIGETLIIKSSVLWFLLPLTVLYLEALVGPFEARQLARDFGPDYYSYASRVPKWLPRLRSE